MARTSEYYRGKRKKRNRVLIPAAILLGILSLIVVLFYGMQKYAVITKDDVRIVPPILKQEQGEESEGTEERGELLGQLKAGVAQLIRTYDDLFHAIIPICGLC